MSDLRLPIGEFVEIGVNFVTENFSVVFSTIRNIFRFLYDQLNWALTSPPFWVIILLIVAISFLIKGWKLALGSAIGLMIIVVVDLWSDSMSTLALVILAASITILISIPLGILAAKSDLASRIIRPVLDFMQTMPAFVYLIPALMLFRIGVVPGLMATIIFAMAPGVRLTELGIRAVDSEVIEAGKAFGSTDFRILRQIQLPLAMPSIMAGINQIIMLSLSMVVVAGLVGAGGLGQKVITALNRIDIGLGFEAGISVVIIAIILDRLTAVGSGRKKRKQQSSTAATQSN